jgi:hypothetical protein
MRRPGIQSIAISLVGTTAILPFIHQSFVSIQSALLLVIFSSILMASFIINSSKPIKFATSRANTQLIGATVLLLMLAMLELAHASIGGLIYCISSAIALTSGYALPSKYANGRSLTGWILLALLVILSINYRFISHTDDLRITSNYLGAVAFLALSLWYASSGHLRWSGSKIWIAILLVVTLTFTRSVLLGGLIGIAISYYSFTSRHRFIVSILATLAFTSIVIVNFQEIQNLYNNLQLLSLTGKNFETGRGEIWLGILRSMTPIDYLLGGVDLQNLSELSGEGGKQLSAHNGYISVLTSNGIMGLLLVLAMPIFLAITTPQKDSNLSRFFLSFIFAFFAREFFEVTIPGNNFPIAGLFWFTCGVLISKISASPVLSQTKIANQ